MCTKKYVNFKRCEHKSMRSSKQVDMRAYYRRSNTHVITRSTKKVNIQAHVHLILKVNIHLTVQLPLDLSTIIKAYMCPRIQLHERFGLQVYKYIVDKVCSHVVKK